MKEKRALLSQQHPKAGEHICEFFFSTFHFPPLTVIGGYWPIGSELDIRPLLHKLAETDYLCALPSITPGGLVFRLWTPSTYLEKGAFDICEPPLTLPQVFPTVLLVPLLAYDKGGHRLGYGQGHYDRYLHEHKAITIGVGFKDQEIEMVPRQSHDFALQYILTDEGALIIKNDHNL
ncbi:MAG: 5-formyltetrahydrofolate cyclo-ligase [Alphaproteobacteria bacterium]|nr:5-formyltetrahydrofolate cyclo-ligase [Alphaproteobacteria bacterium]